MAIFLNNWKPISNLFDVILYVLQRSGRVENRMIYNTKEDGRQLLIIDFFLKKKNHFSPRMTKAPHPPAQKKSFLMFVYYQSWLYKIHHMIMHITWLLAS